MPDLRDRFAGLDAAPAPDLWPDVVRRAAALQPDVVAIPVQRDRPVPLRLGGLPALALLALLLVAALVGGVLVAGGYVRGPFLGVAPSPSNAQATPTLAATVTPRPTEAHGPAAGKIPPCDPASTGLGEIIDTSNGSGGVAWIAADAREAQPLLIDSTDLAVIGSLVDGRPKAIYVLDTSRDTSCVLAEVPVRLDVASLTWSPSGDALAVTGTENGVGEVFVWSNLGMRRVWASGADVPRISWSPSGAELLVVSGGVHVVHSDGSPAGALDPICKGAKACPRITAGVWSPDGKRIAFQSDLPPAGPDELLVMDVSDRRAVRYPTHGVPMVISWNAAPRLYLFTRFESGNFVAHVVLFDPDAGATDLGSLPTANGVNDLSPVGTLSAWTLEGGHSLTLQDIQPVETVVRSRAELDAMGGTINELMWSPTGQQLAYRISTNGPARRGLWIFDVAARTQHQIGSGEEWALADSDTLGDRSSVGSWRPSFAAP